MLTFLHDMRLVEQFVRLLTARHHDIWRPKGDYCPESLGALLTPAEIEEVVAAVGEEELESSAL